MKLEKFIKRFLWQKTYTPSGVILFILYVCSPVVFLNDTSRCFSLHCVYSSFVIMVSLLKVIYGYDNNKYYSCDK